MEGMTPDTFASLIAYALVGLVIWALISRMIAARRGPSYRRSRVYKVWPKAREFRVFCVDTWDEVEQLIGYLHKSYGVEVIESDPEPDEAMWLLGNGAGQVELYFDDHERTRIRSVKDGGILFKRLLRDIAPRRRLLI